MPGKTYPTSALLLLTHCPSPVGLWCAAWRPSYGHEWGGRPAPASSGPGFHSSRAKAGGTNPPRSSAGGENGEEEKVVSRQSGWWVQDDENAKMHQHCHNIEKISVSDTRKEEGDPEREADRRASNGLAQISFRVLLLFAKNVWPSICCYSSVQLNQHPR